MTTRKSRQRATPAEDWPENRRELAGSSSPMALQLATAQEYRRAGRVT
jgi:hypothetical protein